MSKSFIIGDPDDVSRVEVTTPVQDLPRAFIPRLMLDDPQYDLVKNNPIAWQKLRIKHDFEYWCQRCVVVKDKMSGRNVPLILNAPQLRLARQMEQKRLAGVPIRVVLLKARQWGGSTVIQMYMAWIQLVHQRNWNSIICAQNKDTASLIRAMFEKLLDNYPPELWDGDEGSKPQMKRFNRSDNISHVPGRGCCITIASYRSKDAARGSDIAMAHLSEVAFWNKTKSNTPKQLVSSIVGSIAPVPLSFIAYESTANGINNYFYERWLAQDEDPGDDIFCFVPWFELEMYALDPPEPLSNLSTYEFWLRDHCKCTDAQIYWYRNKQRELGDSSKMQAEYPSTPDEAFKNTGFSPFELLHVNNLRRLCSTPTMHSLVNDELVEDLNGNIQVWQKPADKADYIVTVDVGGRSENADFSVIAVLRYDGEKPEVVAQWRGHEYHDVTSNLAVKIARTYNDALLVIESNSFEHDESAQGASVLNEVYYQYPNLYYREADSNDPSSKARKPGFHTNKCTKSLIIQNLAVTIRDEAYIERDIDAIREILAFEERNGKYQAKPGSHDDILMTRAIALYIAKQYANEPEIHLTEAYLNSFWW